VKELRTGSLALRFVTQRRSSPCFPHSSRPVPEIVPAAPKTDYSAPTAANSLVRVNDDVPELPEWSKVARLGQRPLLMAQVVRLLQRHGVEASDSMHRFCEPLAVVTTANEALRSGAARRLWRCGRSSCCSAPAPRPSARLDCSIIHAAGTHSGGRWSAATPGCGLVSRIVRTRRPFDTHGHPSCCELAARYQHRRRLPAMDACGMISGEFVRPFDRWPVLTSRRPEQRG
jgi:hypothetical protein